MKICFASLRKKINYSDVLEHGMDVFYESFKQYTLNNKQHEYSYYNFAFGKDNRNDKGMVVSKAERDLKMLEQAEVIIFPAVQEFIYFADAMNPREIEKSQSEIRKTYEYLNDKHIILLTQDRGVDENLVMNFTFEKQVKPKSFKIIDEMDFALGLHGLKYHYIQKQNRFPSGKNYDFIYWGSDKSKNAGGVETNDDRLEVIKSIAKDKSISSKIIGRWPASVKVEKKWISMKEVLPYLDGSYTTLCFNWIDQTAVTGRYHESVACDVFPFVWKEYDTNNILVCNDFQRVFTKEELCDKIKEVKKSDKWLTTIKKDLLEKLPSETTYYKAFESVLNDRIKR